MVNSQEFAKRLQKILDYYGLSATAFSEKIDFNRSTISHLLSGRNKPSLEFVLKVLDQFPEVELYWFLNGAGHFPAASNSEKQKKVPDLKLPDDTFRSNSELPDPESTVSPKNSQDQPPADEASEIERIVLFFKDGSFKSYE